jgi:hypothetical protein
MAAQTPSLDDYLAIRNFAGLFDAPASLQGVLRLWAEGDAAHVVRLVRAEPGAHAALRALRLAHSLTSGILWRALLGTAADEAEVAAADAAIAAVEAEETDANKEANGKKVVAINHTPTTAMWDMLRKPWDMSPEDTAAAGDQLWGIFLVIARVQALGVALRDLHISYQSE